MTIYTEQNQTEPPLALIPGPLLVRLPNWVGDLVMATAVLEALARAYPGELTLCGKPWAAPVLAGLDCARDLLPAGRPRGPVALFREVSQLRQGKFGAALVLPNSIESALIPWLARIPFRGGTLTGRSLLLTAGFHEPPQRRVRHRLPRRQPRYMGDLYADLAALVGVSVPDSHPHLAVTGAEEEQSAQWRGRQGLAGEKYFLLNPGAAYGAAKLWPLEMMARAGELLHQAHGWRGIVLCGPSAREQDLARQVAAQGKGLIAAVGDDLVRLGPLKPLVRDAALMVTMDSGPRHIAVAFSTPAIVLIGPTDPRFTDRHLESSTILLKPQPCSPCHLRVCTENDHRCLRDITPEMVMAAVPELIK